MSEPNSPDPSGTGASRDHHEGFASLSAGALSRLLDHLEARAELFRWEAREAKSRLTRRIVCFVAGSAMVIAAYSVGIAALVGWLAQSQSLSWPVAAGFVALGHLLLGLFLLFLTRRRGHTELFPDSIAELQRDREFLRRRSERTRSRDPN